MSPKVLARVLYNNFDFPTESSILLHPAVLENYVRSGLIDESYPALVPSSDSCSVTGIVVRNVSQQQVDRLDEFEGDEYERRTVVVHDLENGEDIEAQCYIWVDDLKRLTGVDWDFEEFLQNRFKDWIEKEMKAIESCIP
ncbi:hypothetical protein POJ06DRAFT_9967 [Lipomyces tetrasporus]|uniref:Putative gamma-glutamylcyclotransferase n=1 Tax=Lipomyces tetrasporus TaxID=54092 RepID=A0AAD7VV72_9ASCO|nr:uncharacterized protein POJ06DRAFT_9967 [Lipomyces tetrasporus]KAJ8103957.1 hypothetical protein POJ06DRAFT_9967 [Lipomyces tetrasporus]